MGSWQKVCALAKLQRERRVVLRTPEAEIVVWWADQQAFAVDNSCPHQGYPLDGGYVDLLPPEQEPVVTCPYHGWRFRLRDGQCLLTRAQLTTYPTEVRADGVWVLC